MKAQATSVLKLTLKGDEATDFKKVISVLAEGVISIGYKSGDRLNENQIKLLKDINKKINS
jgi:hypothetical protein